MRRAVKVGVLALLWMPALVLGGHYATGQTPSFVGFDMSAKATAARFTLNSPGLGLPARPTGEFNVAHSEATLVSGPSAYGLGSIAWPGQVVAALPPFLQAMFEEESGEEFPFDLPAYPIRAETFFPQGPMSADLQLGTMLMRSSARESFSDAQAHLNRLEFPGIGRVGSQTSFVTNGFDRDGSVTVAEAAAGEVSLLGGQIQIDSVVSRAVARSDGTTGTVTGQTVVTGAEIAGIPVVIETDGVHVDDFEGPGLGMAEEAVNEFLTETGVSISLAPPVDLVDGPRASRALGGVIVRIDVGVVDRLLDEITSLLPDELRDGLQQLRDEVPIDQVITVDLAPAAVSTAATVLGDFGPPDTNGLIDMPVGPVTGVTGVPPPAAAPPVPGAAAPGPGQRFAVPARDFRDDFAGVPLWLVLALLGAALLLSRPLILAADRFMAAGAGAACPEETDWRD